MAAPVIAGDEKSRVRLGAQPDTTPEVLHALAADAVVTVRAALALNPATPVATNEFLSHDADERVRALLARKLALLAPALSSGALTLLQRQTLDTLTALAEDETVRVRAAIADVVKDLPEAPRGLILRLARDDAVMVCAPIIQFSPLLTSDDLVSLVAAATSSGTRLAVAQRPAIDAAVSEALASGGTDDVVLALLMNGTAQIQEATLDALVARSVAHPDWHDPLVRRPMLSERSVQTLSRIVADHLLSVLSERSDLDPALAADLRTQVRARLDAERGGRENAPDANPSEAALLDAARNGDKRRAIGILAAAAGVPLASVHRAVTLRSAKGLVSLAWKAGFSMRAGYAMQILLARLSPGAALRPGPGNGFPLAVQEMCWQLDFLKCESLDDPMPH